MSLTEKSLTNEKRKHPRFNIDLPVKYSRANLFFKYGRVANASEGGMLVNLPEEMETGKDIALKIFFPPRSEINSLSCSSKLFGPIFICGKIGRGIIGLE